MKKRNQLTKVLQRFWLVLAVCALPLSAFAQAAKTDFSITGIVTDASNEPIVGATVQIVGTSLGILTEADGTYNLQGALTEGSYTLQVSFVGYAASKQSVEIKSGNQKIDFKLNPDALNLDEVVVTGASPTTTRKQLGNSISVVNAEKLEKTGSNNALGALSGKVMGAQISQNSGDPAGGFSIRLRGAGSVNSSSDPLYIVDGVIVDNSSQNVINRSADAMTTGFSAGQNRLVDLNPSDIDRVEVLNGAAAAAIYGSRASNGVVQIFTKRGKSGKPTIEFSSTFMVSQLRKSIPMTEVNQRFGVKGSERLETNQDRLTLLTTLYPGVGARTSGAVLRANNIRYDSIELAAPGSAPRFLISDKYGVTRYNYWDYIFQTATGTDNNLSFSGGSDKTQYFASFGYYNNDGIIKNTNYQKYTGRLNLDQTLTDWAKLSLGLAYTYGRSQDMPNGNNFFNPISSIFIMDNVWKIDERDADGNLKQVERVRVNPLSIIENYKIAQTTNRTTANARLQLFPLKGLSVDFLVGSDAYTLRGDQFQPRLPYGVSGGVSVDFFPDGYAAQAVNNVQLLNNDLLINYNTNINKDFTSNTTAGYTIQYNNTSFLSQEVRDLSPFITTIKAGANLFKPVEASKAEQSIWGYFIQHTLGYKDQIFLTLAGRWDGSSAFATQNQNLFFPKASMSWVLSDYWKSDANFSKILSTAKVRVSYGEAGNLTGIGAYDRYNNMGVTPFNGVNSFAPSRVLANEAMRPERMRELEVGGDFAFMNNRFGLSINLYRQRVTDLLFSGAMSPSGGATRVLYNAPDSTYLQNRGIEIQLSANVVKKKDFRWDVTLNWSANRNEVWGVPGGILSLRGSDGTQTVLNGQPFGVFYGRYFARDNNGNILYTSQGLYQPERGSQPVAWQEGTASRTADGRVQTAGTTELRKVIGNPNPDWVGAFSSTLQYKRLAFSFQFDAFWGGDMYNWNRITANNVGWGDLAEKELRGEVPRGTVASIAGGVTGQRIQEYHIEDASYIKLRELALTYDLTNLVKGFKGLNISIIGRNLLSFDKYQGFDPETNSAGQSDRVRGDDFGNVPIPRMFSVRLGAKF